MLSVRFDLAEGSRAVHINRHVLRRRRVAVHNQSVKHYIEPREYVKTWLSFLAKIEYVEMFMCSSLSLHLLELTCFRGSKCSGPESCAGFVQCCRHRPYMWSDGLHLEMLAWPHVAWLSELWRGGISSQPYFSLYVRIFCSDGEERMKASYQPPHLTLRCLPRVSWYFLMECTLTGKNWVNNADSPTFKRYFLQ